MTRLFLLTLLWTSAFAEHDVDTIVKRLDRLFRSDSSEAQMEMTIETPNWSRTMKMQAWSRGLEDTFIVIESPKKDKGIATLRRGDEMWNYFPKVDKVIKVPPSMMMGSWMGSDFTNDDLVKESTFLDDYTTTLEHNPDDCHLLLVMKPKEQTVTVWDEIRILVRTEDYIPVEQAYFDERGEKVRIMYLKEVKELGGREIPTVLEMVPQTKDGHRTVVRYHSAQFDHGVPDDTFSIRNLKRRR